MKRLIIFLLACAVGLSGLWAFSLLPADESALIREKYTGWTGVLRVWVLEDWEIGAGSLERWLNFCADGFEKTAPGVRVHVKTVRREALIGLASTGIDPPDVVIYPAGVFSDDGLFLDINVNSELRRGLWDGGRAVPAAISVCAWAWNAEKLDALPGDMSGVLCACPSSALGAVVCLSSGLRSPEGAAGAPGGLDLGLGGEMLPEKTAAAGVECRLGDGFTVDDGAVRLLRSGNIDAAVAGMRALPSLAEEGRGVALTGAAAFVDGAAFVSVVKKDGDSVAQAADFVNYLLCEGQSSVARAGALGAAEVIWGWQGTYLSAMEASIVGMECISPAPFADAERFSVGAAAGGFIAGELSADEALARMR